MTVLDCLYKVSQAGSQPQLQRYSAHRHWGHYWVQNRLNRRKPWQRHGATAALQMRKLSPVWDEVANSGWRPCRTKHSIRLTCNQWAFMEEQNPDLRTVSNNSLHSIISQVNAVSHVNLLIMERKKERKKTDQQWQCTDVWRSHWYTTGKHLLVKKNQNKCTLD